MVLRGLLCFFFNMRCSTACFYLWIFLMGLVCSTVLLGVFKGFQMVFHSALTGPERSGGWFYVDITVVLDGCWYVVIPILYIYFFDLCLGWLVGVFLLGC